jgi:glycine/serine hydroxymethyltransferase
MKEKEVDQIADFIDRAIKHKDDLKMSSRIKKQVLDLTGKFPLYSELREND